MGYLLLNNKLISSFDEIFKANRSMLLKHIFLVDSHEVK